MPLSNAEKQRRYRAHKRGDHTLCPPERHCEAVEAAIEAVIPPPAPLDELGPGGQELWDELQEGLGPAHRRLLREACRIADRLDRIDALLRSREWFAVAIADLSGRVARVTIDAPLGEARQQAATLRQLVTEIRAASPKTSATKPATPEAPPDEATQTPRERRSRRTAGATGSGEVVDFATRISATRAAAAADRASPG